MSFLNKEHIACFAEVREQYGTTNRPKTIDRFNVSLLIESEIIAHARC